MATLGACEYAPSIGGICISDFSIILLCNNYLTSFLLTHSMMSQLVLSLFYRHNHENTIATASLSLSSTEPTCYSKVPLEPTPFWVQHDSPKAMFNFLEEYLKQA